MTQAATALTRTAVRILAMERGSVEMGEIEWEWFMSLKGEFEAEGATHQDAAAESSLARAHGLDYLIKIGGCEARNDMNCLIDLGITSIVAPMIETPFAMHKYLSMLPAGHFTHVGVTIETVTAVGNIEAILDTNNGALDCVTIGRTDLAASFGVADVNSLEVTKMVKAVAAAARARGLDVIMGGGINKGTQGMVQQDDELQQLVNYVETRKAVMAMDRFLTEGIILAALHVEEFLLKRRLLRLEEARAVAIRRINEIRDRC